MLMNKKTALFTTRADVALPLWQDNVGQIYYYKEELPTTYPEFDEVYFRDPFNEPKVPITDARIAEVMTKFFENNPNTYSIDGVRELDDLYVEDKYRQYQEFGSEFMPRTWLATEKEFEPGKMVLKKRVSCRCRDVYFEVPEGLDLNEYIVQERKNIKEEMRVFYLKGEVCRVAETRTSKTEKQKVKVLGWRELTDEETDFVSRAMKKMPEMDFVGVDFAILEDGTKIIIEVNRSPQFMGYYKVTGVNLAKKVF